MKRKIHTPRLSQASIPEFFPAASSLAICNLFDLLYTIKRKSQINKGNTLVVSAPKTTHE
jgi:hypothetical protein